MRLLLATNNPGKVEQIKESLKGIPWQVVTPREIGLETLDVDEAGKTLEENARLKARGFFEAAHAKGHSDVAVLADDGGFEIDALNGEPGIYARRWAGENASDEEIIAHTLKRMEGVPHEKRTARFRVCQVLIFPDEREEVVHGTTEGFVAKTATKNKYPGLPYGALLVVGKYGKIYDELTPIEQATTHRSIALSKIRAIIMQYSNNVSS